MSETSIRENDGLGCAGAAVADANRLKTDADAGVGGEQTAARADLPAVFCLFRYPGFAEKQYPPQP